MPSESDERLAELKQVIEKTTYTTVNDKETKDRFIEQVKECNDDDLTVDLSQGVDMLETARRALCVPDFPTVESYGQEMGHMVISVVQRLIYRVISEEKGKPSDFHTLYLEFIMQMVELGPLSGHIPYISTLMTDGCVEFQEYFQGLRGKALTQVVTTLKKDYVPDKGMDWDTYSSHLCDFSRSFFQDGFCEEQTTEARSAFLDLYMYFRFGFVGKDESQRKAMYGIGEDISRCSGDGIIRVDQCVQETTDPTLLKQLLTTVCDLVLSPAFPQDEDVVERSEDTLREILRAVGDAEVLNVMYGPIMDLALDMTISKAGTEETKIHFSAIGSFFYDLDEDALKDNFRLFDGLMSRFLRFIGHAGEVPYLQERFVEPVSRCLGRAVGATDEYVREWVQMLKALFGKPSSRSASESMSEKEKPLQWKNRPQDIKAIFILLNNIIFPHWLSKNQLDSILNNVDTAVSLILWEARKKQIAKLGIAKEMLDCVFRYFDMHTERAYAMAYNIADQLAFNVKRDKELMVDGVRRVTAVLDDDSYDWDGQQARRMSSSMRCVMISVIGAVRDGKVFTWDEYDDLIYLCKVCQTKMVSVSEPLYTAFFDVYNTCSYKVMDWVQTMNESHRLIPLIPGLVSMLECEYDSVQSMGDGQMALMSYKCGSMFASYLEKLLVIFLDREQDDIMMVIWSCYEFNPGPLVKHFDGVFEFIHSGNSTTKSYLIQLLQKVAIHQPQLFTQEKVGVIVKVAKGDKQEQAQLLMILNDLVKRNSQGLEPYVDDLMKPSLWLPVCSFHINNTLQFYALASEDNADKVTTYLMSRIKTAKEHNDILFALNASRLIGFKYRSSMEKHRAAIEAFKEQASDNDLHACCVAITDMLDGKSLDKLDKELKELQGDVDELEDRVTVVENDVVVIKDATQRQGADLNNVKNKVTQQGHRLDKVSKAVDDTTAKVQEIDGKTLSHAPYWARDVSRLLNVTAEKDWRLLSLRLGYSNSDIRAWAQHADPCMAMLNEWYTTHKTRDATHAILTSLQLLDREDAAVIVENAMKSAEAVVEDTDFEYATPPDIFLSYQWGHQNEVLLLRQHLEMAGFSCWMDVGQMGGGDKLFEKIDTGIRGAKVVISCVSGKYAKSPNCNREVNLSVNLGKPMIPLLMEKTTWPPPGSMGPIFSEYLFIRFFQRKGEETTDQKYWPLAKFRELLMQLAGIGLKPDQKLIKPEYKNWWVPKIEEITVDKDRAKKQATTPSSAPAVDEKAAVSPDVFISYQWGKQPQILKLYKTLTSLGYSCWLDIMQMGGGDSLYDKIDRGLRGCRVVLSCITTKYSKSANCRREVSLADAVQKPLIPLLLETLEWPPPGPMSPILTQLLYINCTKGNMEETWKGPKFDELIAMINQHVPKPSGKEPETKAGEEKSEKQADSKTKEEEYTVDKKPQPEALSQAGPVSEVQQTMKPEAPIQAKPVSEVQETTKPEAPSQAQPVSEVQQTMKPEAPSQAEPVSEVQQTTKPEAPSQAEPVSEVQQTTKPEAPSQAEPVSEVQQTTKPEAPSQAEPVSEVQQTTKPEAPSQAEPVSEVQQTTKPEAPSQAEPVSEVKQTTKPEVPSQSQPVSEVKQTTQPAEQNTADIKSGVKSLSKAEATSNSNQVRAADDATPVYSTPSKVPPLRVDQVQSSCCHIM